MLKRMHSTQQVPRRSSSGLALTLLIALHVLVLTLSSTAAHAQTPDEMTRARAHFEAGRALYTLGKFDDALREFTSGYQLVPRPEFVLNLAQTYRRLGRFDEAQRLYRRFLAEAPANDPKRKQVTVLLAEVDAAAAAAPVAAPQVVPATPAAPILVAAPPPRSTRLRRQLAWILPTAGALVLAGVGVGLYFGLRPQTADCGAVPLGCLDATHAR
jgi:tetratricopeptide (TPR) repeat protein